MQILTLETPFMGLKPIEKIEIRRFLLLIGEQASGKSTLAKLIYFFQKVPDYIYERMKLATYKGENLDSSVQIGYELRDKFYETFGHITQKDLNLTFYYTEEGFLKIYKKQDNKIYVELGGRLKFLSTAGKDGIGNILALNQKRKFGGFSDSDNQYLREELRTLIDDIFNNEHTDFTYMIAGRSTTVAFPEMIETRLAVELENMIESNIKKQQFGKRIGNERLLLQFILWSKELRTFFKNAGGSFFSAKDVLIKHESLDKLILIFERILKGKYDYQNGDECLFISENEKIGFKDASSGQQEVLRILQGIFIATGVENRREFMVVEEPEAHLFPIAQKEIMNAFALFLNTIPEGKLIITTHSPYILACVNILLMAKYVANQKQNHAEAIDNKIISHSFWLNSEDFSAYSLGHEAPYCVNLKDEVTGFIAQNYLDSISETLGMQYQQLYHLLTR